MDFIASEGRQLIKCKGTNIARFKEVLDKILKERRELVGKEHVNNNDNNTQVPLYSEHKLSKIRVTRNSESRIFLSILSPFFPVILS